MDSRRTHYWNNVQRHASPYDSAMEKVSVRTAGECWPFVGALDNHGYGQITYRGKRYRVTRLIAAKHLGSVDGLDVCHRCDNPSCCNPTHLFLGTRRDNMRDAASKGRVVTSPRLLLVERYLAKALRADGHSYGWIATKLSVPTSVARYSAVNPVY